jgi:hypothetical protein
MRGARGKKRILEARKGSGVIEMKIGKRRNTTKIRIERRTGRKKR